MARSTAAWLVAWCALALGASSAAAQPRKAKPRAAAATAPTPWAGEWAGPWCAEAIGGGPAAGDCGTFVLTLVQRRDRLCGRHAGVAPASGRRLAGAAQSALGKVRGRQATIVVTAGEPVVSWLVQAERSGRTMRWRVLERLASPDAVQRPVDLPGTATLAAGRDRAALEPVRSECRAHFVDPD